MSEGKYAGPVKRLPAVRWFIYKRLSGEWEEWDGPFPSKKAAHDVLNRRYGAGDGGIFIVVKQRVEKAT